MRILSIQSCVVYGHVGNSAAVFALQRLGHEVWPVPTALLAHHTGYGSRRGAPADPAAVRELIDGLADLGVLARVDAVLTGYLGSPELVAVVRTAVEQVRQTNPAALVCCDPVLGDTGRGFFVPRALAPLIRDELLPLADIATPNVFELAAVTGRDEETLTSAAGVVEAAGALRRRGPRTVLVTSVGPTGGSTAAPTVGMIAVCDAGAFQVATPRLPIRPDGAGDLTAALFLGNLHLGVPAALARTAAAVHAVLAATVTSGERELQLVAAQDALVSPPVDFEVVAV